MPRNAWRVTAAAALAAALLSTAACSDDGEGKQPKADGTKPAKPLKWGDCDAPTPAQGSGPVPPKDWQCATLDVPLDYADPGGETIPIALIRAKARDQKNRLGSLVFNFGGPGGSGVATLPGAAKEYEALRARYDLVSFDPRGVGASAPVRCEDDKQLDVYYSQDSSPDTPEEEKTYVDNTRTYQQACKDKSGKLLPHVGTPDAARDLDRIRQALGDEKLNYFGVSYGTELGGVYAHLFPKNVGRAVFDAVVDPTKNSEEGAMGQAKGFQLALDNFAQDCVDRGDECLPRQHAQGDRGQHHQAPEGAGREAHRGHRGPAAHRERRHQRHRAGPVLQGAVAAAGAGARRGGGRAGAAAAGPVRRTQRP